MCSLIFAIKKDFYVSSTSEKFSDFVIFSDFEFLTDLCLMAL